MRTLSLHLLHTPAQRHWSSLSWKHRMDQSQRKGPDGAQDARFGITPMPDLPPQSSAQCRLHRVFSHTVSSFGLLFSQTTTKAVKRRPHSSTLYNGGKNQA